MDFLIIALAVCVYLWILCSKDNENVNIKLCLQKVSIFLDSIIFMVLSTDSKGVGPKKNPDPDLIRDKAVLKKKVVFIRHGESDWNNVFNKGMNISLFGRLFSAMVQEFKMFASLSSVFIDSPLNFEGIEQALELDRFIQSTDKVSESDISFQMLNIISGRDTSVSSIIVSSSLRRAIATTTLGLWSRLEKTSEKIHILSSLQEISRNIDTYSLSPVNTVADLPFARIAPHCGGDAKFSPQAVYDASENFGNKTYNFYGIKRLRAFNEWVFKRDEEVIIVGGHSLWFKNYFQTFMPHSCLHDAKTKKMVNSGVLSFEVYSHVDEEGVTQFRVDPASVINVYGGFTTK